MNKLILTILFAVLLFWTTSVFAQVPSSQHPIAEVKQTTPPIGAPKECLAAFREFFGYLQKRDTNIVRDEPARKRWLSENLRKALMQKVATFTNAEPDPEFPDNGDFIGAWDYPTTYSIIGSKRYGKRAIIDVFYKWGPKTNYPGDERTTSFIFILEDGAWKLDDIYSFRGEFATAESLDQRFRQK